MDLPQSMSNVQSTSKNSNSESVQMAMNYLLREQHLSEQRTTALKKLFKLNE